MAEKYLSEKIIPALKAKTETKFAEAYGDDSTTALSQKFLSEKLNGQKIAIASGANATSPFTIAIGAASSASGDTSIALGGQSVATVGSVALGWNSKTTREGEVAIGNGSENTTFGTRYLANVKAGELDTDAINVKQLNDTIGDINTLLETLVSGTGVK